MCNNMQQNVLNDSCVHGQSDAVSRRGRKQRCLWTGLREKLRGDRVHWLSSDELTATQGSQECVWLLSKTPACTGSALVVLVNVDSEMSSKCKDFLKPGFATIYRTEYLLSCPSLAISYCKSYTGGILLMCYNICFSVGFLTDKIGQNSRLISGLEERSLRMLFI